MALTLTIGTPYKAQGASNPPSYIEFVDFSSIVIQNSVQVASDTMEFDLIIHNNEIDSPVAGNEVIFKDDDTIEFGGVLTSIDRTLGPEPSIKILHCSCKDYVYYLNRRYVNKLYASQAAGVTVKEILTDLYTNSNSDVHYEFFKDNVTNVDNGDTLAAFTFDKIVPSQAFDMIAQSTGMQWWIDFDKKVYFKLLNTKNATFLDELQLNIEDDTTTHYNFTESESVDGIATQIILRDMTLLSTTSQVDRFTGLKDGKDHQSETKKIFELNRTPFTFLHVASVSKNTGSGAVNQDLKYEDIDGQTPDGTGGSDDVFIFVKDQGSYVRFASANTVGDNDVIIVTYRYIITDDLEDPDFRAVDEMAKRTGGDGVHQFVYSQTSGMRFQDLDDAETVTNLLRQRKSQILRRGSFSSRVKGWQAGQAFIRVWPTVLQTEGMYVISVTKTILTPADSGDDNDSIIESEVTFSNIPYGIAF
jgi:hypothetical protein